MSQNRSQEHSNYTREPRRFLSLSVSFILSYHCSWKSSYTLLFHSCIVRNETYQAFVQVYRQAKSPPHLYFCESKPFQQSLNVFSCLKQLSVFGASGNVTSHLNMVAYIENNTKTSISSGT